MTRAEVFAYAMDTYGTSPDYPWKDGAAVLRHENTGKWYALIMNIEKFRLGLDSDEKIDVMNLKCPPQLLGALLSQDGYHRAYHMNKEQWVSVCLDGNADKESIKSLIDLSYSLTEKKLIPKRNKNKKIPS